MRYELREASLEMIQLALWLQMMSRSPSPPTEDQISLVLLRLEAGLKKVKLLRALGGEGVTPGE